MCRIDYLPGRAGCRSRHFALSLQGREKCRQRTRHRSTSSHRARSCSGPSTPVPDDGHTGPRTDVAGSRNRGATSGHPRPKIDHFCRSFRNSDFTSFGSLYCRSSNISSTSRTIRGASLSFALAIRALFDAGYSIPEVLTSMIFGSSSCRAFAASVVPLIFLTTSSLSHYGARPRVTII